MGKKVAAEKTETSVPEEFQQKLNALESRITKLEGKLTKVLSSKYETDEAEEVETEKENLNQVDNAVLESRIFEYGLAWLGSIILIFGIIFLMTFMQNNISGILAAALSFGAAGLVFFLAYYLRNSFPYMAYMFTLSGHLLVFYIITRLFFFTSQPLLPAKGIVLVLLLASTATQIYFAIKRKSELMAFIGVFLTMVAALFFDQTHITLPILAIAAGTAFYLFTRYGWWRLVIASLVFVYFSHISWLFGNPMIGHPFQLVASQQYNLIYLFIYGAVFSITPLVKQKELFSNDIYIATILVNAVMFSLSIFLVVIAFYLKNYVWIFSLITALCLGYSVILQKKIDRPFDPSFYACFGFMTLSIAIYGYANLPYAYFYLALQSLLVVSISLWFRSRIIVIMNTLLFIGILLIYLAASKHTSRIDFSFVITAIASSYIINWQKERLTLKTDLIRNIYDVLGFLMVLYSFYFAVPKNYVTISWTAVAVVYFVVSILFHKVKYRWMAIVTLLFTCIHLFLVDLANLEIGYRVIAFLFLAVISLGASLYYTKRIQKKSKF
jgi:hypothetical protein